MNNWKDETGDWHNDFNAVAWSIEIDGEEVMYQKPQKQPSPQSKAHEALEFDSIPNTPF